MPKAKRFTFRDKGARKNALAPNAGWTAHSINSQFEGLQLVEYNMQGSQKATTTVNTINGWRSFDTHLQMHSEMCAIDYMLNTDPPEWGLLTGKLVRMSDGRPIGKDEFKTAEPHCGFCTYFLKVLGLPLGKPTRKNFNLSGNLNYPLPEAIRHDASVLARVLDKGHYAGFNKIKAQLNKLVNVPQDQWVLSIVNGMAVDDNTYTVASDDQHVLAWQDLIRDHHDVLDEIWRHVFESLRRENDRAIKSKKPY